MRQKLSAGKYIRNNWRRVMVLIVSLTLCLSLTYITGFLLTTTEVTFTPICLENTKKMQYAFLSTETLGIPEREDYGETVAEQTEFYQALAGRLKSYEGVEEVYCTRIVYSWVVAAVGQLTLEIPLVEQEQIPVLLSHMDATLIEGRLPEAPGEIVLDSASVKNQGYELNDYFSQEVYTDSYRLVGILSCDSYFGCGIPSENYAFAYLGIVILSDGSVSDISSLLSEEGIWVQQNRDMIIDEAWGQNFLKEEIIDQIGNASSIVYVGILLLLAAAVLIVYMMYLRDRHSEWCLYCSIGYSRKDIWSSIIRELLFTFGVAFLAGTGIIALAEAALYRWMIVPLGLRCRFFLPDMVRQIIASYVLILGLLQLPIYRALYRIRTVDAIDEEFM